MEKGSANLACREIRTLYALGALGGLTDAQLLEAFLERRGIDAEEAFAALVQRHGALVLSVCRRILPSPHDAEDAFQGTFLILVRRAASIGRREKLASWLYGVAVRTAKEARRRAARQQARERRWGEVSQVDPSRVEDQADLVPLLDEELNRLPSRYRAALVACELEGKSRREAALQLGLAEGTLSAHLARGRKLLRERLHRRGVSLGAGPLAGLSRSLVERTVSERLVGSTVRVALGYAAGGMSSGAVPATVAALVERVLKTTIVTRLAGLITAVVAFGLTAAVTWAAVLQEPGEPPTVPPAAGTRSDPPAQRAIGDEAKTAPHRVRVHGTVVDELGKPVPAIEVRVNNVVDRLSRGVTDANGQFDFRVGVPSSLGTIFLAANADRTKQGAYFQQTIPVQPIRIVLRPAHEVAVRVLDRDGKPVADAVIAFLSERNPVGEGRTDVNGRWTVRVPADSKRWLILARKSKVGFDYASAGGPRDGQALLPVPNQLTLTLDGARTTRIKAVDRDGNPIAGVNIGVWNLQKKGHNHFFNSPSLNPELWPATGEDGVAVLDWLPKDFGQAMGLGECGRGFYALDQIWVRADPPTDLRTITLLSEGPLSGRVTHADGRPAVGIVVSASGQGPGQSGTNRSTRTDEDGRYAMSVGCEQAYIVAVDDQEWAAPCRGVIPVRSGQPVVGVDFVLARATRLHGRITVGKKERPIPKTWILATIDKGEVPEEIRLKGQPYNQNVRLSFPAETDVDGRYEFRLGPGEYRIEQVPRTGLVTVTIPADHPPAEIRRDFRLPRPQSGPFAGQVLDVAGHPVAGAVVTGEYPSSQAKGWFRERKTDEQGRFREERSLDVLLLYARSADRKLAGVARIEDEVTEGRVIVGPVATATGRLFDLDGKAVAGQKLSYCVRIHVDEMDDMPFRESFGGMETTDAQGRFTLPGLVPGQTYHVMLKIADKGGRQVAIVTPKAPGLLDLGDQQVDTVWDRPYVPPTPEQLANSAFLARKVVPPRERKDAMQAEARRSHTRPLLLFGRPADAACIDLFRAFDEELERDGDSGKNQDEVIGGPPSPRELRWDFELASFDMGQPGVLELAEELGVATDRGEPPLLAVLANDGTVAGRFPLRMNKEGKLDRRELATFLQAQKLASRDAETMLSEALVKAKAEDKTVFLIFSASWCGPCRRLARFLDSQKVELERHYVFVKPDMSRDEHAKALRQRYPESKGGGVPWFAILDAEGNVLITSNAPKSPYQAGSTNIGFPVTRRGVEHFLKMLKETAPRLHDDTLTELGRALAKER